jgi:hypothetical protein
MSKFFKFLAWLYIVITLGLVSFILIKLTIENFGRNIAVYGTRNGSIEVIGSPSILVNVGILGLVCSAILYSIHLFNRSKSLLKAHYCFTVLSIIIILVGMVWSRV